MMRSTPRCDTDPEPLDDSGFGLIPLLIIIATYKRVFIGLPLAAALIAAAISIVMPEVYGATTRLLPVQQARPSALLLQLTDVAGAFAGRGAVQHSDELYAGMLSSRNVQDSLIEQFDLQKIYKTGTREKTREKLKENTFIRLGKDGLITIDVEDGDRNRAAKIANAYADALLRLTRSLALSETSKQRVFFEEQFQLSKRNLAGIEMKLSDALHQNGILSVDDTSSAMVKTIGILTQKISAKEIELGAVRGIITPSNPNYLIAKEELNSLRGELSKLETGRATGGSRQNTPTSNGGNVLRELKYQQTLYELRARQYEVARLDEANTPSVVQVLDRAVAPEKKLRPKRAIIVIVTSFYAFCGAIFWVFFSEVIIRATRMRECADRGAI